MMLPASSDFVHARRATLVIAALGIVFVLWPGEGTVFCQSCPKYVVTGGNTTILVGPILNQGECPVNDKGYVMTSEWIKVDVRAQVSGHCTYQLLSGNPLQCTVIADQDRTVNTIFGKYFRPGSTFEYSLGNIGGTDAAGLITYRPILDSRIVGESTGPLFYMPLLVGEYRFNAQASINGTICALHRTQRRRKRSPSTASSVGQSLPHSSIPQAL